MRFLLDAGQRDFARSLHAMLSAADTPAAVRAWAAGDSTPGRALWARLAGAGVFALAGPERHGGLGPLPVELAVAFTELGRHAVPGPLVETVAAAVLLDRVGDDAVTGDLAEGIASGRTVASLCLLSEARPFALDADAADAVLVVEGDTLRLAETTGPVQRSADPARRLARPGPGPVLSRGDQVRAAAGQAADVAALATAAQCLGLGRALLDATVSHARQRVQFGVPVGSFQAVKHRLADTLIGLEFARPLLYAAALALAAGEPGRGRMVSAAKVAAGEAACAAARTALQIHGAVGYTAEFDLSLWIRKARAVRDAWGTPASHRARVLDPRRAAADEAE
ncbi:acyl-CoA dehydrogenase family protein [Streptomyces peucetius]|uniref:Acyl-CoA/acyl-ACP dehydrogenase n=1 Tax=Streptomyces peucetius TaxID=1950 RepID=A0ABY6I092_STRPE|nr:acyl-CoA dehydrogenase family protein [Streptomyces peucetius]UYQ60387.1 acyl-CoA/acyl-ACP dehydrogenase [Streptomyces peucetius]